MAVIPMERTVSLDEPIKVEKLTGTLFTAESNAHKFIITCTRGGDPEAVTGTVTARFKRQDGSAVFIQGGVEDGAACVVLTADCYNQPGGFQLTVFTTEGGSTLAIYSAVGVVTSTVDGDLIDGGNTIPRSVDEVAAYLEQYAPRIMTGATLTTNGAAGLVPAPNFLASTYYLRGDGTWFNLYETIANAVLPINMDEVTGASVPETASYFDVRDAALGFPLLGMYVMLEDGEYEDLIIYAMSGSTRSTIWSINFVEQLGEPLMLDTSDYPTLPSLRMIRIINKSSTISVRHKKQYVSIPNPLAPAIDFPLSKLHANHGTIAARYYKRVDGLMDRITALENAST